MANQYTHKDESVLAYFEETTSGQGPGDWSTSGTRIDHTGDTDLTGLFAQEILVDPRVEGQENGWEDVGHRPLVMGARANGTGSFTMLLHGNEDTSPSDGVSPTTTALADLLKHCVGGQDITPTYDVTGGTTTTVTVAATTGWEVGAFIAVKDQTSPTSWHSGRVFIRRITAVTATEATLDEALPFTPAAGDLAVGCITAYVDPDVIVDSTGASGRTLSLYHAGSDSEHVMVAYGCALTMAFADLSRNGIPKVAFSAQCGNWETSADVTQDTDAWTSNGSGAQIVGRYAEFWLEDYGTTTSTKHGIGSIEVGPIVERSKIETVTTAGENLESMAGYSSTAGTETTVAVNIAGFTDDWEADLQAGTYKVARYAHNSTPGASWAIHFPRLMVRETPSPSPVSDVSGNNLTMLAIRDTTTTATTALWRSKVAIVLA